jgi:hypothetical protein
MQTTSYVNGVAQARSAAFDAAAVATIRKPRMKIDILWTDPYIDIAIEASSTDKNYICWEQQVADLITTTPHKYAILDGTFLLDGTYYAAPSTQALANLNQFGWYTESVCDEDRIFYWEAYPQLIVEFSARSIAYLYVVGDPALNQYPVDFELYVFEGAIEAYHLEVTDNTELNYVVNIFSEEIYAATKIVLVLKKWSTANTVGKIVEFFSTMQDTLEGDDIVSANLLEEREVREGSIPIGVLSSNELDVEFQNVALMRGVKKYIDPFFPGNDDSYLQGFLRPNCRMTAYLGFELPTGSIEYLLLGTFWTGEWNISDDKFSCTVSCRDRMEILRNETYTATEIFENKTLYYIANSVLQYAKDNIPLFDLVWSIDAELENFTIPYAWFEKKSYMEVLKNIAEACIGQAYMSKTDVLILESYKANDPAAVDLTITKDNYFGRSQPSNAGDLKNYIEVETQPLSQSDAAVQVYESPDAIAIGSSEIIENIELVYSELPVKDAVATVIEESAGVDVALVVTYYPWGCTLAATNLNAVAGSFKIRVEGHTFTVLYPETVIRQDATSIFENGKLVCKFPNNHLVQTNAVAVKIAENLLASYKEPRKDVVLNWRGNPALELGDTINAPIYQRGSINNTGNFVVYKNKIDFDGTLRENTDARKVEALS